MGAYENLVLPPLEVLFENARSTPVYELAQVQEEIERSLLAKEKRAILSFFSIRGSWQYGNFINEASYTDIMTSIIQSRNTATQNSFFVGAGINIPIESVFDLVPRVKRQRLQVKAAQLQRDAQYEQTKREIIRLYAAALSQINILKSRAEAVVLSDASYRIIERNFANGLADAIALAMEKSKQSQTRELFESAKSELNINLLTLEVITNTQIVQN
ncbi:MAG: TolC family protein [Prevotellaceae bacterium]|nr:TolC family protein [Prevotellaceae bacterium]